jgi:phage/plasmid-like protein (TIGR03299 family)
MSSESLEHLNTQVLVGFTDQRGQAWHHKADLQSEEPNHYPSAIPLTDVKRRLFSWHAVSMPMHITTPAGDQVEVPNRQAIVRDDTWQVLGVPSKSYQPHQYDEWLLTQVGNLLDDDLQIGSAGVLKGGAIGWVQIEMPENRVAAGVEYRPHLLATTSFNGEIATLYKRTCTIVVCDNTRNMALREETEQISVRHTSQSHLRLADARDALRIVHTLDEDFATEIEQLMKMQISERNFDRFLSVLVPSTDADSQQTQTRAQNIRSTMRTMWQSDIRCAPYRGTGFGALQTVNTWRQHVKPTRSGRSMIERTMMDTLTGQTQIADRQAVEMLMAVAI